MIHLFLAFLISIPIRRYKVLTFLTILFIMQLHSMTCWARAGGGDGNGLLFGGVAIAIAAPIIALWMVIYEIRRKKLIAKAAKDLNAAATHDPTWSVEELKNLSEKVFMAYQKAWTKQDLDSVRDLLHFDYYQKASQKLKALIDNGERNVLKSIKIDDMELVSIRDVASKDGDMFVMDIGAQMIDYTVSTKDNSFIRSPILKKNDESMDEYIKRAKLEPDEFYEFWVFIRHNERWKLWEIKQSESILKDLEGLSPEDLKAILKREEDSSFVNDNEFYNRSR